MQGKPVSAVFFTGYDSWSPFSRKIFDYVLGCHLGHALDFVAALIMYLYIWPITYPLAKSLTWNWMGIIFAYDLVVGHILYGFWHYMTYSNLKTDVADTKTYKLTPYKFNKKNQYYHTEENNLNREIFLTTLGLLQASMWQIALMYVYANNLWGITTYTPFLSPTGDWKYNAWSIGSILFVTYWREFHFYWCHRLEHSFGWEGVWKYFDFGKLLYDISHSWHHRSTNPGPYSGLAMHPIEHFMYYTCAALPFLGAFFPSLVFHPFHHLYAKYHAVIAPIAGHDGLDSPGGGSDYHYLHHASFDCNYGVPLIDFDKLFGSWVELEWYQTCGNKLRYAKKYGKYLAQTNDKEKALALVAKEFNTTVEAVRAVKKLD